MPVFLLPLASTLLASTAGGAIAIAGAEAGYVVGSLALAQTLFSVTLTAGSLALSYALQQGKKEKASTQRVSVRQSLPPRRRGWGRVKISGPVYFLEVSQFAALYRARILSEGEIDAVEEYWLGDKQAVLDGSGFNSTLPWASNISFETFLGTDSQAAPTSLSSAFSTYWTANHRLRGLAHVVMTCRNVQQRFFQKVYPTYVPEDTYVCRLSKIYDPRTGATAWSDNAGLCVLDYLIDERGCNIPLSEIDTQSFIDFANLCDEPIAVYGGGTVPRYRVWGMYDLTAARKEVLAKLLASCDGELTQTLDGKWKITGGRFDAPGFVLNDETIRGLEYEQGNDKLEAFNQLKLSFTSPLHDYQPVETLPWVDADSQAETGEVLTQDLTLEFVPHNSQARRLGKIAMGKGNPRHKALLTCNIGALAAWEDRVVRVSSQIFGLEFDGLITARTLSADLTTVTYQVDSIEASIYAWTGADEEGAPPVVPADTAAPPTPPDPVNVHTSVKVIDISPGGTATYLKMSENNPGAGLEWVQFNGRVRRWRGSPPFAKMAPDGDYKVVSAEPVEVSDFVVIEGINTTSAGIDELGNLVGTGSAWVAPSSPPAVPTLTSVAKVSGLAKIDWTNPANLDFWAIRVYRVDSPVHMVAQIFQWPTATLTFTDPDTTPSTRYYAVRGVSPNNVESANSNVIGVVI